MSAALPAPPRWIGCSTCCPVPLAHAADTAAQGRGGRARSPGSDTGPLPGPPRNRKTCPSPAGAPDGRSAAAHGERVPKAASMFAAVPRSKALPPTRPRYAPRLDRAALAYVSMDVCGAMEAEPGEHARAWPPRPLPRFSPLYNAPHLVRRDEVEVEGEEAAHSDAYRDGEHEAERDARAVVGRETVDEGDAAAAVGRCSRGRHSGIFCGGSCGLARSVPVFDVCGQRFDEGAEGDGGREGAP